MNTINIYGNIITFSFNEINDENNISEDFNYNKKIAYATIGIKEILKYNNEIALQIIIGQIFQNLFEKAKLVKLDYLQNVNINGNDIWIIDNGENICALNKDEY